MSRQLTEKQQEAFQRNQNRTKEILEALIEDCEKDIQQSKDREDPEYCAQFIQASSDLARYILSGTPEEVAAKMGGLIDLTLQMVAHHPGLEKPVMDNMAQWLISKNLEKILGISIFGIPTSQPEVDPEVDEALRKTKENIQKAKAAHTN